MEFVEGVAATKISAIRKVWLGCESESGKEQLVCESGKNWGVNQAGV